MAYVLCMNCERISLEGFFCSYCHSSLIVGILLNPLTNIKDGVYLGEIEGENSPLILPINLYFGFHLHSMASQEQERLELR